MATNSLRWGNGTRPPLLSGGGIVLIGLSVILLYQVLVPLVLIVWTSLKTIRPGEPGFLELSFTFSNYVRAYGIREFWESSLNTFYFALSSTLCAFLAGTFLAWTVERTNTPLARLIGMITLGRIIIPGVIITIAWILTASPSIGVLNHIINSLTGVPRFSTSIRSGAWCGFNRWK
jgi:iron(III) transport system permease protein